MSINPDIAPSAPDQARNAQRWTALLLTLILLLAALLRFYHLGASSLWSDEGNTWALLGRSFAQIARDAAADIHPPGYYWLLKLWSLPFGSSAVAMRSFSALLGVLLVYLIYRIGRYLQPLALPKIPWLALLAALGAALNPFQIYYSQEARMYMLLAITSAGLIWSLLAYLQTAARTPAATCALLGYLFCGALGLWTHYSFPIVLVAAGTGYVAEALFHPQAGSRRRTWIAWLGANGLILLLYLPWLPTAIARVLAWPAGGEGVTLAAGLQLTMTTLLVGPRQTLPAPMLLWVLIALVLPLLGIVALRRIRGSFLLLAWWLLPIGLMFGAGLFTDAFLKFLLTASPAWLLLCAGAPRLLPWPRAMALVLATGSILLALITLPTYYTDPTVRDNYAGVAHYVAAVADPQQDLVILDAPGQQEVWAYYDPGVPILALPQARPPDVDTTVAKLAAATAGRHNLYALFWATDEADPDRIVETWLDQHAFKGDSQWQGNLRFVVYTLSTNMRCNPPTDGVGDGSRDGVVEWADQIGLTALCRPAGGQTVTAGEAALIGLHWRARRPVATQYKVTVQLLDRRNQVIAQRDSVPVGGARPTDTWQPNELIEDNHGVAIPVGTPPGTYRMIVALYDATTGARLPVADSDAWVLGDVTILSPPRPFPAALVPVQYTVNRAVGPLTLVGHSAHRQGMAHAPETPLVAGDLVEFTFLWQAPTPLPLTWPAAVMVRLTIGNAQVDFAPAGEAYPTAEWHAGQILQYTVLLPFDGTARQPHLQIGDSVLPLQKLPVP